MRCCLLDRTTLLESGAHSNCDYLKEVWEIKKEGNREGKEKGREVRKERKELN